MVTIIGKSLISFFFCLIAPLYATDLSLSVSSLNGQPLIEAGAGQPFIVIAKITNLSGSSAAEPIIAGVDRFQCRSNSFQMRTINGNSEVLYNYRLCINEPGTYQIGPAEFNDGQNRIVSNMVTVTVGQSQRAQQQLEQKNKDDTAFLRLSCTKRNVVVGEKISCWLRFYSQYTNELQHIIDPDQSAFVDCTLKNRQGPSHGTEVIKDKQYHYYEWKWDLYPKKEGTLTIPAFAAAYVPAKERNDYFWGFIPTKQPKKTYSNSLSIVVNDLPQIASVKNKPAVGILSNYTASLNQIVAKVGEGVVLKLSITGDADFDQISLPLHGVPDTCKWYDSKSYIENDSKNPEFCTKYTEYIIQPLQPGRLEIPAQELIYYDINARTYKRLITVPLAIQVTGQALHAESVRSSKADETNGDIATEIDTQISLPLYDYPSSGTARYGFSMFWFIAIIFIICTVWFFLQIKKSLYAYLYGITRSNKNQFTTAYELLRKAQQENNCAALYSIFITILSHMIHCAPNELTQEKIIQLFKNAEASEKTIVDWHEFFAHISEAVFYKTHNKTAQTASLFDKAHMWLNTLKELS